MSKRVHIRLFIIATLVWAGFVLLGLPSYYQQYSTRAMVWLCALLLIPITAIVYYVLRAVKRHRRVTLSLWMAFYFTVPLALYDWLYCGVYLGHGMRFLLQFWYLTIYYAIPWALLPGIAAILNQDRGAGSDEEPEHSCARIPRDSNSRNAAIPRVLATHAGATSKDSWWQDDSFEQT
jgi:hypothetical protein